MTNSLVYPLDNAAIVDRIKYLMAQSPLAKNQRALAERIGTDPSNFSKYLSGKLPVSTALINKIVVNLGVSRQWLVYGDGIPFPRSEHAGLLTGSDVRAGNPSAGVPVYDVDVTAGCSPLERLLTDDRVIGFVDLPKINPDTVIVRVTGDSMEPRIIDGGFVAIRRINPGGTIFWGQIYVVILDEYRMVKFLRRHPDNPSQVVLHSANPAYDDIDIDRHDIKALFLVETILNFRNVC